MREGWHNSMTITTAPTALSSWYGVPSNHPRGSEGMAPDINESNAFIATPRKMSTFIAQPNRERFQIERPRALTIRAKMSNPSSAAGNRVLP
jgi:hypothetical protein